MITTLEAMEFNARKRVPNDATEVMYFPNGRPSAPGKDSKNSNLLEKQAIIFTIVLYIFICASLLGFHYAAEFDIIETTSIEQEAGDEIATSSSSSPFNPK